VPPAHNPSGAMKEWKEYWNRAPLVENDDPLRQVGKTVNGISITAEQFAAIATDIHHRLALRGEDIVLDLCCGNGAVTCEVARHCKQIVGVDFSAPLIRTARARFQPPNSEYVLADGCDLPADTVRRPFTKIYMYEALQHFSTSQLDVLLDQFTSVPGRQSIIYFGSIPDAARIRDFYNTPDRWAEYERTLANGTEAIGQWWRRDELASVLRGRGYAVTLLEQAPVMHGSHYRFDALCTPQERGGEQ
jgi:cyclopropane fatty-acyl-phospholipid synthase-like methyltransferase